MFNEKHYIPDVHDEKPRYRVGVEEVGLRGFKLKPIRFRDAWLIPELKVSVNLPGEVRGIHLSRLTRVIHDSFSGDSLDLKELEATCRRIALTHDFIDRVKVTFKSRVVGYEGWVSLAVSVLFIRGRIEWRAFSLGFLLINACPCSLVVSQNLYGKPYTHIQKSRVKVQVESLEDIDVWGIVRAIKERFVEPKIVLNRIEESRTLAQLYAQPMFNEDLTREILFTVYNAIKDSLKPNDKIQVLTVSYETLHPYRVFSRVEYRAADLARIIEVPQ